MPLHPSVTLNDYLTDDFIKDDIETIWRKPSDISDEWRFNVFEAGLGIGKINYDYITPLEKGKEWLFELTCQHQPRTGAMIMAGGPLVVRVDRGNIAEMVTEVNGKVVQIIRQFWRDNPSDDGYARRYDGHDQALPKPLADAYYTRFRGMNLVNDVCVGPQSYALPKDIDNWNTLDHYLDGYRTKKKYLPWFNERFPELMPGPEHGSTYYHFRCWLDTEIAYPIREYTAAEQRSVDMKYPIDALFVRNDVIDGPIYHVVNGKLDEMRVLTNPVEAVDLYCEHVLLGREERFDFIEHGRPLD